MKPLSHRFNSLRGLTKGKAKDSKDKALSLPSTSQKENLPEWPQRSIDALTSVTSFEPLPDLSPRPLPLIEVFDVSSPCVDQVLAEPSSRETGNGNISTTNGSNVLKKVAFISPPPSPTTPTDKAITIRQPTPHPAKLGHDDGASIDQSLRSDSPSLPPACWSEGVDEDLATHLGPSERNRQEVMWEIVASEER